MSEMKIEFVKNIPDYDELKSNTLYVSMEFETVIHKCACGCGEEVVTPLSEVDWTLKYNGKVSLSPSIGNWNFECRSHYFIINSEIVWAYSWSDKRIKRNRKKDRKLFKRFFSRK